SWIVAGIFATLSGVLLAPRLNLDAIFLTFLIIQGFGAAAIGAFSNIPAAYIGGSVIGIAAALSTKYVIDYPALRGIPSSLPFIVLFLVLILMPRRWLLTPRIIRAKAHDQWRAPNRVRLVAALGALALFISIPHLVGTKLPVYTSGLALSMLLLSLGMLMKTSGQVSLCHLAFAGIGAATFGNLTGGGVPWLLALFLAGVVVIPVGALVAIP